MTEKQPLLSPCPCGSSSDYAKCCALYHQGQAAPTAQALMRSRYVAYVFNLHDYLHQTWHLSTRPEQENLGGTQLTWIHLSIINCQHGQQHDTHGEVTFVASYVSKGKGKHLEESSRFVQEQGHWLYVDGDCTVEEIGRNALCPCASSIKFKRCCSQK